LFASSSCWLPVLLDELLGSSVLVVWHQDAHSVARLQNWAQPALVIRRNNGLNAFVAKKACHQLCVDARACRCGHRESIHSLAWTKEAEQAAKESLRSRLINASLRSPMRVVAHLFTIAAAACSPGRRIGASAGGGHLLDDLSRGAISRATSDCEIPGGHKLVYQDLCLGDRWVAVVDVAVGSANGSAGVCPCDPGGVQARGYDGRALPPSAQLVD
jgi:hypothetical protein